jgi:hypothetical protein
VSERDVRDQALAPPELVAEATSACLDYVQRATGMMLDFRPETLGILDHYAATVRKELSQRPELAPLVARAMGAYFGEVLRARFPGFWRVPSANLHDWQLCFRVVFLWINPIGVGYDALYGNDDHDGPRSHLRTAAEDREFLKQRLEAIPPVPEDEYYLFTTRYDVIETSIEALGLRLEQSGYGGTEFGEEDYAEAMLEPGAPHDLH